MRDDAERRSLIGKFLDAGFGSGEKVSYFADSATPEEVRGWLAEKGLEIPDDRWGNQFTVLVAEKTYCPERKFVPDTMLHVLPSSKRIAEFSHSLCADCMKEFYPEVANIPQSYAEDGDAKERDERTGGVS